MVTGKPLEMGGSAGRREATGRGVMIVAREVCQAPRIRHQGRRGSAFKVSATWARCPPTCSPTSAPRSSPSADWKSGVVCAAGLDIPALIEYARKTRTVAGFSGAEPLTNDQLFALDLEILIPAALENQITIAM